MLQSHFLVPLSDDRHVHVYTCVHMYIQIYRLRHQAIVEIKGLFSGSMGKTFYLQMPWCEHGTLHAWINGSQRPQWPQVHVCLFVMLCNACMTTCMFNETRFITHAMKLILLCTHFIARTSKMILQYTYMYLS